MPRKARNPESGVTYRVFNTARNGLPFASALERLGFIELAKRAAERTPVKLIDISLNPDGFTLLLKPREGRDMSRYMQWLLTTHQRRYSLRSNLKGPIWQGRYRSEKVGAS